LTGSDCRKYIEQKRKENFLVIETVENDYGKYRKRAGI